MRAALAGKPKISSPVFHREESAQIFRPHVTLTVGDSSEGPEGCPIPLPEVAAGTKPDSPFGVTLK